MKGCRRVAVCLLLVLVLFHASVSPVLASNIGSDEFLKTYDPEKTYEIKPILLPPSESNTAKSQTHERNPNGSVVGSPYANIPDSELSTGEIAAKYGVSVGQVPKQSFLQKIKGFFVSILKPVGNTFISITNWFKGVILGRKDSRISGKGGAGGKGRKNGKASKNTNKPNSVIAIRQLAEKQSPELCSKSLSRSIYDSSPSWIQWVVNKTTGAPSSDCKKSDSPSIKTTATKKATEFKKSAGDTLTNLYSKAQFTKKKLADAWNGAKSKVANAAKATLKKATEISQTAVTAVNNGLDKITGVLEKQIDNVDVAWNGSHEERELMKEIGDKYNVKILNSMTQHWTVHELKMTEEVLGKLPQDFYNKSVLTSLVRGQTDHEVDIPCTTLGYKADANTGGIYRNFCRSLIIYDSSAKILAKKYGDITQDESFKLAVAHELTHAYQFAHQEKVKEFNKFDWVDPPHFYDDKNAIISPDATNCDFATAYTDGSMEEMAELYAMKIVKPELLEQRYNTVSQLKETINTFPVDYVLKPCPTKTVRIGDKDMNVTIPYNETKLYQKVQFNF